jgi:hypothetical protein
MIRIYHLGVNGSCHFEKVSTGEVGSVKSNVALALANEVIKGCS